jgi:hypothetical protein
MSPRSLQRRLAEHGTTWRAELDHARRQRAQQFGVCLRGVIGRADRGPGVPGAGGRRDLAACAKCTDLFTDGRGSARLPAAVMPRNGKETGVASPAQRGASTHSGPDPSSLGNEPHPSSLRPMSFPG